MVQPCDTGSSKEVLEANPEFASFNLSNLPPDWTSKKGFWAPDPQSVAARARWVRHFLLERPEETIVLVAHGDILRQITADQKGPGTHAWRNAEVRLHTFDQEAVGKGRDGEAWLRLEGTESVAGGYGMTSSEMDFEEHTGNGKL